MLFRAITFFLAAGAAAAATPQFDAAMALVKAKRYPEARAALEKVVAAEPANAAAWDELGLVWQKRRDNAAYEQAIECLSHAAQLEPNNADYVGDYGGVLLEYASRTSSISAATKGRAALEKAVELDPTDIDAREGLYQFYTRAPFFVGGSKHQAAEQLEAIRRQSPERATALEVLAKVNANDLDGAFALCESLLTKNPENYTALYQYGRTASVAGRNLSRGLSCLQKALTLEPPGPAAPTHSNVWNRIGVIQQKLGHLAEARAAFTTAVQLDPGNREASSALERLR